MSALVFAFWIGGAVCNQDLKIGWMWRLMWPALLGAAIMRDLRQRKDYYAIIDEEPKP